MDNIIFIIILMFITCIILFIRVLYQNLTYWDNLLDSYKEFIKKHTSFFKLFFLLLFTFEQLILMIMIYSFKGSLEILVLIVNFFALIVITTAALQEFILEVKIKYLNEAKESFFISNKMILSQKAFIQYLLNERKKSKK